MPAFLNWDAGFGGRNKPKKMEKEKQIGVVACHIGDRAHGRTLAAELIVKQAIMEGKTITVVGPTKSTIEETDVDLPGFTRSNPLTNYLQFTNYMSDLPDMHKYDYKYDKDIPNYKKHQETCAKNRKNRKHKNKRK